LPRLRCGCQRWQLNINVAVQLLASAFRPTQRVYPGDHGAPPRIIGLHAHVRRAGLGIFVVEHASYRDGGESAWHWWCAAGALGPWGLKPDHSVPVRLVLALSVHWWATNLDHSGQLLSSRQRRAGPCGITRGFETRAVVQRLRAGTTGPH